LGRRRFQVVFGVVVLAAALAASATWAFGGGTAAATFAIELDGDPITTAKSYVVDGASLDKKSPKEYTIRVTLSLTDNAAPAQAFQNGQTFDSLKITLYTPALEALKVYEWANATVLGYRQTGDAATNTMDQDLVFGSTSLTVSTP
jgi:hypothetical protein